MSIDLSKFVNMFGAMKPELQKRLEALLRDVNEKTWNNAYSIILDGHGTVWQYVCHVDISFPRSARMKGNTTKWDILPSWDTVYHALLLAQANVERGKRLVCGEVKG